MANYLQKPMDLLSAFRSHTIQQVPRAQNAQANALAQRCQALEGHPYRIPQRAKHTYDRSALDCQLYDNSKQLDDSHSPVPQS